MAPEHGAPRGGAQVCDPHGPHLGSGHPGDHGVVDAAHLLAAAGDHHGPPPRAGPLLVPDPGGFHDRLRPPRHARHPLRLRPRARPAGAPRHGARPRHLLPPTHGHRLRHLGPRHPRRRLRRAPPQGCRRRCGHHRRRDGAAVGVLAGAAVRAARGRRGLHLRGAPRVHVRPGPREHAQHGNGALLALHLDGELREHGARGRRPCVERRRRWRQLAAGQHQPRQAGLLLLGGDDAAAPEPGVLPDMRQAVHVQAGAAPQGRGRGWRQGSTSGTARKGLSSTAPLKQVQCAR
uniref:Uncharacterized protein n=1 Tax=Arundo donax TaxID=35708 RepID=A0A0A9CTX8_ARUDO